MVMIAVFNTYQEHILEMFHATSLEKMSFLSWMILTKNADLIKFILSKVDEIDNIFKHSIVFNY